MQPTAPPTRAGRREWLGLGVLALACLLYVMDLTVLDLAVPAITADLRPSSSQLLWIIDAYGFMVAGALVTMGTLGDRIGRRRLLMGGAAAFGVVSLFAAFATSPEALIASRALLGLAGATIAPATLSMIFHMFTDPRQRTLAVGVWYALRAPQQLRDSQQETGQQEIGQQGAGQLQSAARGCGDPSRASGMAVRSVDG